MLEHRSSRLDGSDNTGRKFEHRVQSSRSRQSERLDRGCLFPVSAVQHRWLTPKRLTSSCQNFYFLPTTVRPFVGYLLTEDGAAELYLHLLHRFSGGFTGTDCYADYCVPRFDGCRGRRLDDSCSDYRFGCGDVTGKVSDHRSIDSHDLLANFNASKGENIRAYWQVSSRQTFRAVLYSLATQGAVVAISNGIGPIVGASLSSINSESW